MAEKVLTLAELRATVREGSQVLWVYRENVEIGTVVIRSGDSLDLCWLEGYKSRNDTVKMGEVLGLVDERAKNEAEVFPFTIRGHLTKAGVRWVQAHPREAAA